MDRSTAEQKVRGDGDTWWITVAEPCSYCAAVRSDFQPIFQPILATRDGPCCHSHWQTLYNEARVGCWACAGVHGAPHVGCLHNKHQPALSTAGDACSYSAATQASAGFSSLRSRMHSAVTLSICCSTRKARVELLACAGVCVVGVAVGRPHSDDVLCQLVGVGCSGGWIPCPLYCTVHAVVASCSVHYS